MARTSGAKPSPLPASCPPCLDCPRVSSRPPLHARRVLQGRPRGRALASTGIHAVGCGRRGRCAPNRSPSRARMTPCAVGAPSLVLRARLPSPAYHRPPSPRAHARGVGQQMAPGTRTAERHARPRPPHARRYHARRRHAHRCHARRCHAPAATPAAAARQTLPQRGGKGGPPPS